MDEKGIGSVLYDANKLSTSEDYRYTHFYCMRGKSIGLSGLLLPQFPSLSMGIWLACFNAWQCFRR